MSATGQFLSATNGHNQRPPTGSFQCPLTPSTRLRIDASAPVIAAQAAASASAALTKSAPIAPGPIGSVGVRIGGFSMHGQSTALSTPRLRVKVSEMRCAIG